MGKLDNDKFKLLKEKHLEYRKMIDSLRKNNPAFFRCDEKSYNLAIEIYSLITDIDEKGIYSSNIEEFYMISYDVTKEIGLHLLRTNHYYMDGNNKFNPYNAYSIDKLDEIIESKEKINEAVGYLNKSILYLEKTHSLKSNKELFIHLYHNICEAYKALDDEFNYLITLDYCCKAFDLNSICESINFLCSLDNFNYDKIIEKYVQFQEASKILLSKQKRAGVNSWLIDVEQNNGIIKNIKEREDFDRQEFLIMPTLKNLYSSFINNHYYNDALNLCKSLKEDYKEYAFWDSRFIKEFDELFIECNKIININKYEITPSDKMLSDYFTDSTIHMMSNDIKIYIGTSLYIFNSLERLNDFTADYSPAVISLFKALEDILYTITIDNFLPYIKQNSKKYYKIFAPDCIYDKTTLTFHGPSSFDFGTGLKILCKKIYDPNKSNLYSVKINTGIEDFLISFGIKDAKIKILNFYDNLQKCKEYRNLTAHKTRVTHIQAIDVKKMIFETIRIIEKTYCDFGNIIKVN